MLQWCHVEDFLFCFWSFFFCPPFFFKTSTFPNRWDKKQRHLLRRSRDPVPAFAALLSFTFRFGQEKKLEAVNLDDDRHFLKPSGCQVSDFSPTRTATPGFEWIVLSATGSTLTLGGMLILIFAT